MPSFRIAALFALLCLAPSVHAQFTISAPVLSDQREPAADGTIQRLDVPPVMGDTGAPAHRSTLKWGTGSEVGIYSGLDRIMRTGGPELAPGTTASFSSIQVDSPFANANGHVAFYSSLAGGGGGIWTGPTGGLQLIARTGDVAPGTTSNFSGLTVEAFNNAGQVAFRGQLEGASAGTTQGFWAGLPGSVTLVAREGAQAAGFPDGVKYAEFGQSSYLTQVQFNDAGQFAFCGSWSSTSGSGDAIWLGAPGALQVVAKTGDAAPETESGLVFRTIPHFGLNASGHVAFVATLKSTKPVSSDFDSAIYAGAPGALKLVAREGFPAPGLPAGAVFSQLSDFVTVNASGEVFFKAYFKPTPNSSDEQGIWVGRPGQLRLIAQTQAVAPGTNDGSFIVLGEKFLSDSGQVAFSAFIQETGGSSYTALFATDKTGVLRQIARTGAGILGSPDVNQLRLCSLYEIATNGDGRQCAIDAQGRFAFMATWGSPGGTYFGNEAHFVATFEENAPLIPAVGQPADVAATLGGSATFQVTALGSRPVTYQWKLNNQIIEGASGPVLTVANLTEENRGAYTVEITNALGTIASNPAQLTFPPVITGQPQSKGVGAGADTAFQVIAEGPGTLGFQWQHAASGSNDFSDVPGANQATTLSLPNVAVNQAGRYRVQVSNADGIVTSSAATLTVAPAGQPILALVAGQDVENENASGLTFGASTGVIDDNGDVAFEGGIFGPGVPPGSYFGVFGGMPPDYGIYAQYASNPNLGDSGTAVMESLYLHASNDFNKGILHGTRGNMQILAQEGMPAPGTDGGVYLSFGEASISASGKAAFLGWITSGRITQGLFMGAPGSLQLVAGAGDPAPGMGAGVMFSGIQPVGQFGSIAFNDSDTAIFGAILEGTGITSANDTGIWTATASSVQRVLAEGSAAPGAGAGVKFGELYAVMANAAGEVVFGTDLTGTGVQPGINDKAIYAGSPAAPQLVARTDMTANNHKFLAFWNRATAEPLINAAGQVVFQAFTQPTGTSQTREGLWRWTPGAGGGTRQLIVSEGQQAPGCPAGVVFDHASEGVPFFQFTFNAAGQVAFVALLAGPGVDTTNDRGLWMTSTTGEVRLVARHGGMIDLGGGVMKQVNSISTERLGSGGDDGLARIFNAAGELVFACTYDNFNSDGFFRAKLPSSGTAAPSAITTAPSGITQNGATLNASVNPNDSATDVYFEYGTSTNYGQSTPVQSLAPGTSSVTVSQAVAGLTPGTTYHYRVVASNGNGSTAGSDVSFMAGSGGQSFLTLTPEIECASDPSGQTTHRGDQITYRFRYKNTGEAPLSDGLFVAGLPEGTKLIKATKGAKKSVTSGATSYSWKFAQLPAGAEGVLEMIVLVIDPTAKQDDALEPDINPIGGQIRLEAYFLGATGTEAATGPALVSHIVNPIEFTAVNLDDEENLKPGSLVTFEFTIRNKASYIARNIVVSTKVPLGLVVQDVGDIPVFVDASGQPTGAPIDPISGKQVRLILNGKKVSNPYLSEDANGDQIIIYSVGRLKPGGVQKMRATFRIPFDWTVATDPTIVFEHATAQWLSPTKKTGAVTKTNDSVNVNVIPAAPNAPKPKLALVVTQEAAGVLPENPKIVAVTQGAYAVPDKTPKRDSNEIIYRFTYFNIGNAPANFVRITVPIPERTDYVKNTARIIGDSIDAVELTDPTTIANSLVFNVPFLEKNWPTQPGSAKTLEFKMKVDADTPVGTQITMPGGLVTSRELLAPALIVSEQVAQVVPKANMIFNADHFPETFTDTTPEVRQRILYVNQGGVAANGVTIRYVIPPGLKFKDADFCDALYQRVDAAGRKNPTRPAVGAASGEVIFQIPKVAPGQAGFVQVILTPDPANVPRTATSQFTPDESFRTSGQWFCSDSSTSQSTFGLAAANLTRGSAAPSAFSLVSPIHYLDPTLAKTFILLSGPAVVHEGDEFTYQLAWGNISGHTAGIGGMAFPLPEGTELVEASGTINYGDVSNDDAIYHEPGEVSQWPNGAVSWITSLVGNAVKVATIKVRVKAGFNGIITCDSVRLGLDQSGVRYNTPHTVRVLAAGESIEEKQLQIYATATGHGASASLGTAPQPGSQFIETARQITGASQVFTVAGADYAHIAGNGGIAIPLGGGNMVAAGAGNIVAAGAGNLISDDGSTLVAAGAGNAVSINVPGQGFISGQQLISQLPGIVAAGAGNIVGNAGGNLVQRVSSLIGPDGGSLVGPDGASLIGMDGATLIGLDGATLGTFNIRNGVTGFLPASNSSPISFAPNAGSMVAAGAGNLVAAGAGNIVAAGAGNLLSKATLVGPDGASVIGQNSASVIGQNGASVIGGNSASVIGQNSANILSHNGAALIGNDAGSLTNVSQGGNFARGGLGFQPNGIVGNAGGN